MNSAEKLRLLRQRMQEQGMDAYVVVTDDFHGSEYVGDYFKAREYLSGFTGSAGTQQPDYLGPSFDSIMAFGPHGAIVHYEPTAETDVPLEPRSFCLADTGGHIPPRLNVRHMLHLRFWDQYTTSVPKRQKLCYHTGKDIC